MRCQWCSWGEQESDGGGSQPASPPTAGKTRQDLTVDNTFPRTPCSPPGHAHLTAVRTPGPPPTPAVPTGHGTEPGGHSCPGPRRPACSLVTRRYSGSAQRQPPARASAQQVSSPLRQRTEDKTGPLGASVSPSVTQQESCVAGTATPIGVCVRGLPHCSSSPTACVWPWGPPSGCP